MGNRDLAVVLYTPSKISKARREKGVHLYGEPRNLRCPGGKVYLINENAQATISFVADSLEERPFRMSTGGFKRGCFIKAKRGSLRAINGPIIQGNWHGEGSFRFIKPGTIKATIENKIEYGETAPTISSQRRKKKVLRQRRFNGGIQGLQLDHPEARLVQQYVKYMGNPERFVQHGYAGRLYCDLFDLRQSRLIEAKMSVLRESIRMAYGQLCDYRRFYTKPQFKRRPRLAVLLPEKPAKQVLQFLSDYKTLVIWKKTGKAIRFTDSADGHWTKPSKYY